ncbi:hypothetical protein ACQCSX_12105 [Pseudarthrobacter sp. P1]|uniref:hypothetical protein n=1 Tax=Pseudarthrobacter sp. P1 TaxID=3418418 RepID=UPI003CF197AF
MTQQQTTSGQDGNAPAPGQAMLGPLTARDLTVLGSVLVIFIGSILPIVFANYLINLWNAVPLFFLGIGILLPLAVAALFLVRRFSPSSTLRIGSLSVDQFASVVAGFATAFFFLSTVTTFGIGFLVGLLGSLGLLAATVGAAVIPLFAVEFAARPEASAHRVARDAVPAQAKPAPAATPAATTPRVGAAADAVAASEGTGAAAASVAAATAASVGTAAAAGKAGAAAAQASSVPGTTAMPVTGMADTADTADTAGAQTAAPEALAADAPEAVEASGGPAAEPAAADALAPEAPGSADGEAIGIPENPAADAVVEPADVQAAGQVQDPATVDATAGTGAPAAVVEPAVEPEPAVEAAAEAVPAEAQVPAAEAAPAAESIGAVVDPSAQQAYDAFWFAVDRPRPVVDEASGAFLYNVEPGNWVLALADRGHDFLVQDTDGRVGVLRDLSGIERAPEGA